MPLSHVVWAEADGTKVLVTALVRKGNFALVNWHCECDAAAAKPWVEELMGAAYGGASQPYHCLASVQQPHRRGRSG